MTLIGNLGRDPELKYTPSGDAVVKISVATSRKWTSRDGSPGEETVWFRCTAWRKLAETINQYLSKGRLVYIEGRLEPDRATGGPRVFTRSDGTAGASFEMVIDTIKLLGSKTNGDSAGAEAPAEGGTAPVADTEIPF
jgi:single-strand DNA-binding protein